MPHLLAIAIGPVQDFIAASRKTRDLWYGSDLLSRVSRAAAVELERRSTVRLIFPAPRALAADTPVANKLLAIVDGEDPAVVAEAARRAARKELGNDLRAVLDWLDKRPDRNALVDHRLAKRHVARFLEFAAAWYPYDPATYESDRRRLERLLAGRKALRDFSPAVGVAGRPKSSLDSARETVIRGLEDVADLRDAGADVRGHIYARRRSGLKLKTGEQLDGVSLIKRLADFKRFVSLSRVAVDPFIRRAAGHPAELNRLVSLAGEIEKLAGELKIDSPVESFEGFPQYEAFSFDTQLFYDPGLRDLDRLRKELRLPGLDRLEPKLVAFQSALGALKEATEIAGELPIYLAVLRADGDRMGEVIGTLGNPDAHRQFSASLVDFAAEARCITQEDHHGALVYSGGDDVLAFLPLDQALSCAAALRAAFGRIVGTAAHPAVVSLSVGIAIGHYSEHLQNLLAWAHDAEQAAKHTPVRAGDRPTRDALAVALHTRSGGATARTVVHSWETNPVKTRWQTWVDWHRCGWIPDGAGYKLQDLYRELAPLWPAPGTPDTHGIRTLLQPEVARLLARRREGETNLPMDKERTHLLETAVGDELDNLRQLIDELIVTRRIAAAADVAGAPLPEGCRRVAS